MDIGWGWLVFKRQDCARRALLEKFLCCNEKSQKVGSRKHIVSSSYTFTVFYFELGQCRKCRRNYPLRGCTQKCIVGTKIATTGDPEKISHSWLRSTKYYFTSYIVDNPADPAVGAAEALSLVPHSWKQQTTNIITSVSTVSVIMSSNIDWIWKIRWLDVCW